MAGQIRGPDLHKRTGHIPQQWCHIARDEIMEMMPGKAARSSSVLGVHVVDPPCAAPRIYSWLSCTPNSAATDTATGQQKTAWWCDRRNQTFNHSKPVCSVRGEVPCSTFVDFSRYGSTVLIPDDDEIDVTRQVPLLDVA